MKPSTFELGNTVSYHSTTIIQAFLCMEIFELFFFSHQECHFQKILLVVKINQDTHIMLKNVQVNLIKTLGGQEFEVGQTHRQEVDIYKYRLTELKHF